MRSVERELLTSPIDTKPGVGDALGFMVLYSLIALLNILIGLFLGWCAWGGADPEPVIEAYHGLPMR